MKLDVKAGVFLAFGFAFGLVAACLFVSPTLHPAISSSRPIFEMAASDLKPATTVTPETRRPTFVFPANHFEITLSEPPVEKSESLESKSLDRKALMDSILRKPNVDLMDSRGPDAAALRDLK